MSERLKIIQPELSEFMPEEWGAYADLIVSPEVLEHFFALSRLSREELERSKQDPPIPMALQYQMGFMPITTQFTYQNLNCFEPSFKTETAAGKELLVRGYLYSPTSWALEIAESRKWKEYLISERSLILANVSGDSHISDKRSRYNPFLAKETDGTPLTNYSGYSITYTSYPNRRRNRLGQVYRSTNAELAIENPQRWYQLDELSQLSPRDFSLDERSLLSAISEMPVFDGG